MLDEVFSEAIIHAPPPWHARVRGYSAHTVLGLRLRPFSFWHAFNLDLIQYNADRLTEFTALLLSARCCQLRCPQTISSRPRRWSNELATARFKRKFDLDFKFKSRQLQRWFTYRKDYADCIPELETASDPAKLPWYLLQVVMLRRAAIAQGERLTKAQAWNAPVTASQWWMLADSAAQGFKVDLITPEDRKDFAEMEAEAAKKIIPMKSGSSLVTRPPRRSSAKAGHSSLSSNG